MAANSTTVSPTAAVRVLIRNVPTSVCAEELYDALAFHHGGAGLLDALFLPVTPGLATTMAFADYRADEFAAAAAHQPFWVDGTLCAMQRVGQGSSGNTATKQQQPSASVVLVRVEGLGPLAFDDEALFRALVGLGSSVVRLEPRSQADEGDTRVAAVALGTEEVIQRAVAEGRLGRPGAARCAVWQNGSQAGAASSSSAPPPPPQYGGSPSLYNAGGHPHSQPHHHQQKQQYLHDVAGAQPPYYAPQQHFGQPQPQSQHPYSGGAVPSYQQHHQAMMQGGSPQQHHQQQHFHAHHHQQYAPAAQSAMGYEAAAYGMGRSNRYEGY